MVEYWLYAGGYVLCGLVALAGLIIGAWRGARSKLWPPLAVFGLCLWSSTAASPNATPFRAWCYAGLLGAFALSRMLPEIRIRPWMGWAGSLLAVLLIGEAALDGGRPAFLANPNITATWCLLLLGGFQPVTVAGIVVTQSRATLVALAAVLGLKARRRIHPALLLLCGAGLTLVLCATRTETIVDRLATYSSAAKLFAARPLTGWGAGSFGILDPGHDHADSAVLTIAAEQGLAGLGVYGWLVAAIARAARRSASPARWVLLALAVQNLADDTVFFPMTAILVGLNLGMLEEVKDEQPRAMLVPGRSIVGDAGSGLSD